MPRLFTSSCLLALILGMTVSAPSAKADQITQILNGFTLNSINSQRTSTLSGYLTLDTDLLPPQNTGAYNVDPFSAFSLNLIENDGTVINYTSLTTSLVFGPYGGATGCGFLSGASNSCTTLLMFTSGGDPNLELDMTITNYFDQQVGINYDDTDAPFFLRQNGDVIRGTFTQAPEPGTLILLGAGLLGLAAVSFLRKG
jgi:hypothetical protein